MNGSDLAAAIGRVQLRRLGEIADSRRRAGDAIRDGIDHLKAVSMGRQLPRYRRVRILVPPLPRGDGETERGQGGLRQGAWRPKAFRRLYPTGTSRPSRRGSGNARSSATATIPGDSPTTGGDRNATFPCPNAVEAAESHFTMPIHENYGDEEVSDIIAALEKVETAYLK